MKAFVTGATGFVGSHVARVLAEKGAELRLLVRSSSNLKNIEGMNAERVVGDLRDPEQMYKANVEGTRALLRAAKKSGVRRVVYTSSVATMGFTSNGHLADE